jgi:hypothetical protein
MLMQRIWIATALFVVVINSGCSGPNAASVSGNVTLEGQPLTTGMVSFYPEGGNGAPANGQIDSSGNYSLSTGTDSGLAPGKYIAIVVATKDPPQPYDKTGAEIPPIPITPAKYGSTTTSDLRVEVKAGKNAVPLPLQSSR